MKLKSCIILTAALAAGLFGAEWKVKDGAGSLVLKDSSPDRIDLKIDTPETVTWAWEDDRASFLNIAGGSISGPADKLLFPDGMTLEIAFSANLRAGKEWLPLVTCGNSFQNGYSVWVRNNGQLLVCFPGASKWYMLCNAKIQNLRDYTLKVIRDGKRVLILLNNAVAADYASTGKVKHTPGEPFRLASTPKWKFYGNIYSVKLRAFRKGDFDQKIVAEEKLSGSEIKPVTDVADPAGTVVRTDLYNGTPRPGMGRLFQNRL